jgi:hypothetical protein
VVATKTNSGPGEKFKTSGEQKWTLNSKSVRRMNEVLFCICISNLP